MRCLEPDKYKRFHDGRDLSSNLEEIIESLNFRTSLRKHSNNGRAQPDYF